MESWAVIGDSVSGHKELTPKGIPQCSFCRNLSGFVAQPPSSCFALIGTGF